MKRLCVAQLSRFPQTARVKTRLQSACTAVQARLIHERLSALSTARLAAPEWDYSLWIAGGDPAQAFASETFTGVSYQRQPAGNLGEKMAAIARQLLQRYSAVILVGSDCPYLSASDIREASTALTASAVLTESADIVLVPATDGGYVLMGLSQSIPPVALDDLFAGIHWGSAEVLTQTLARAERWGLTVTSLKPREDIDTPADLRRLIRRLNEDSVLARLSEAQPLRKLLSFLGLGDCAG